MEPRLARKFLYLIAAIILLVLGVGIAYQLAPGWFGRVAFVPSTEFEPQAAIASNAYDDAKMWLARPGLEGDPSAWRPQPRSGRRRVGQECVSTGENGGWADQ